MNKDQFLDGLKEALTDSVPPDVVRENLQYYSDYIDEEERKGRSEEEVLEELGNPRLIAHTIIDTTPEVSSRQGDQGGYGDDTYTGTGGRSYSDSSYHSFNLDLSKWYWKLIAFIVMVAFFMLIISVITGLMTLLIPVLPIIIIVGMIMWIFGGHGR